MFTGRTIAVPVMVCSHHAICQLALALHASVRTCLTCLKGRRERKIEVG